MPTNQKRHTCIQCGTKRVEKYMHRKFGCLGISRHWYCNDCSFNANEPNKFDSRGVRLSPVKLTPLAFDLEKAVDSAVSELTAMGSTLFT